MKVGLAYYGGMGGKVLRDKNTQFLDWLEFGFSGIGSTFLRDENTQFVEWKSVLVV